ncbi:metallophosphoesterase family protein [Prosthecobacter sp.]|jgi:diadenosine tetraphosphatase ApaH/serine/threonine PP2A family protein phosphatase|uniref:metallophosphoesterase family protein n=1 Tax=Prosthecobacter sp. TaxID=1965333 RepID=UPI0037837632
MNNSVAIISDIHGNTHALRAVLQDIANQGISKLVCLGDVVGYGGSPGECVDLLREQGIPCVRGNHDAMVSTGSGLDDVNDATRQSIEWTRDQLSEDQIGWLAALPMMMQGEDYEAVHACLHHPDEWGYVLRADAAALSFRHQTRPVCFIGHTHRPAFWVEGDEFGVDITAIEALKPTRKCLVNVGAVGQPRDRDERACYAIYRRDTQDILWRRVSYDVAGAQQAIIQAGLPAYFAQRLELGR